MRISDWSSDVCSSDLWLLRRTAGTRKAITNGDGLPRISLVIAAHNEASVIESKVRNALALDYPRELLEVIVTDDGSTADTAALAQRSEERRVGKECVSTGGSRGSPKH